MGKKIIKHLSYVSVFMMLCVSTAAHATNTKNGTQTEGRASYEFNSTEDKDDDSSTESNGTKTGDPSESDTVETSGSATSDRATTKDSGYPTLTALLNKYFSI